MPKKNTATAQKVFAVYLIINGLFLLPMNLSFFSKTIGEFCFKYLPAILFLDGYYMILLLVFVHFALNVGILLYSVWTIISNKDTNTDKDWAWFGASVLAVAFSAGSNAFGLYILDKPGIR